MASKKARVLSGFSLDGITYQVNHVIEAEASLINQLAKDGTVDAAKEAVAHAMEHEGAQVIVHQAAAPAADPVTEDPAAQAPATEPAAE